VPAAHDCVVPAPPDQRTFLPLLSLDEAREVRLSREPLLLASRGSVKLKKTEHCPKGPFSAYLPALEAYAREKRDSAILSLVAGVYHHGNLWMSNDPQYGILISSETGALVSLPVLGGTGSRVLFAVAMSDVAVEKKKKDPYLDQMVVRAYLPPFLAPSLASLRVPLAALIASSSSSTPSTLACIGALASEMGYTSELVKTPWINLQSKLSFAKTLRQYERATEAVPNQSCSAAP
jgi:hypothetical protein